jgi:predicted transcriptional regulator
MSRLIRERWDMRLTDKAVLAALLAAQDNKTPISQEALAEQFTCNVSTVKRSMKRLKNAGKIVPVCGGRRVPMTWRINHVSHA